MHSRIYLILLAEVLWLVGDWLDSMRNGLLWAAGRLVDDGT